jgi:L-fuculose-phosphate aldolase
VELDPRYADGLLGIQPGAQIVLVTWLHQSNRDTLQVYPKWREDAPLTGVFFTRSPDRPNPIGLHRVRVLDVQGTRLEVTPLEAIDGTPVVDIKAVLEGEWDS